MLNTSVGARRPARRNGPDDSKSCGRFDRNGSRLPDHLTGRHIARDYRSATNAAPRIDALGFERLGMKDAAVRPRAGSTANQGVHSHRR